MKFAAVPLTLREANAFVASHHRHHGPVRGMKFAVGCESVLIPPGESLTGAFRVIVHTPLALLCGVVIVGRPKARLLDDGRTAEVTRLCTDGTPHAASFLLGCAWRAARAMGYRRMVSYLLDGEAGVAYSAAGWRRAAKSEGDTWRRESRRDANFTRGREPLADALGLGPKHPEGPKIRWEVDRT